jgi:hypothetical protein
VYVSAKDLTAGLDHVRATPSDTGRLRFVVRRPRNAEREVMPGATLDPVHGLLGDNWRERGNRHTPDGSADPAAQVTLMNVRVAQLVAGTDPERIALAGDQLYVDFDLSCDTLPPGALLAVGSCVLEVSATPHTGCRKFVERFGADAMRFVNSPLGRRLRLRGMNARVVVAGTVAVGDAVTKADGPDDPGLDGSVPGQDRLICAPRADLPTLRR